MGKHRALRSAGGAGRVEEPGEIIALAGPAFDRVGIKQRLVFGAADRDQTFERFRSMGRDLVAELARCEADASAGMFQNVAELATVKFCIGRHRSQSGMPNAKHQLHVIGTILRGDGDTFAWLKEETVTQRRRELCRSLGDFILTLNNARTQSQGRSMRPHSSRRRMAARTIRSPSPISLPSRRAPHGCRPPWQWETTKVRTARSPEFPPAPSRVRQRRRSRRP